MILESLQKDKVRIYNMTRKSSDRGLSRKKKLRAIVSGRDLKIWKRNLRMVIHMHMEHFNYGLL